MNVELITLDTHVLVYAVDKTAKDKHRKAQALVDAVVRLNCVLTLQVLCEFYFAVTRKGKMPAPAARARLADWQALFPVVAAKPGALNRALAAVEAHRLGFWDALLWATARDAGVTLLLSEDFQSGTVLDGVRFADPFAARSLQSVIGEQ